MLLNKGSRLIFFTDDSEVNNDEGHAGKIWLSITLTYALAVVAKSVTWGTNKFPESKQEIMAKPTGFAVG